MYIVYVTLSYVYCRCNVILCILYMKRYLMYIAYVTLSSVYCRCNVILCILYMKRYLMYIAYVTLSYVYCICNVIFCILYMQRYFMYIVSAAQICKSHLQRNHIGKILIFRLQTRISLSFS